MNTTTLLILVGGAYLVGSISWSQLFVKMKTGTSLREHGSGNLGATNAGRVLGKKWAVLIYVLDLAKGLLAVAAPAWIVDDTSVGGAPVEVFTGLASMLGHIFPFYLQFRGGKGVATGSGVVLGISPMVALASFLAWFVTLKSSRMVSAASIVSAVSMPIAYGLLQQGDEGFGWFLGFFATAALLVVIMHRANLVRIFRGEEPRTGVTRS